MSALHKGDVIQFNNNHNNLCGCFGFVNDVEESVDDVQYSISIPMPEGRILYITSMVTNDEFDYIGKAVMMPLEDKEKWTIEKETI